MPMLRDLDVHFVSLVDRAAVRNAEDPTQPQRFLVWKREGAPEGDHAMPDTLTPEETQAALEKAQTERDSAQEALTKAEGERDQLAARIDALEKAAKKPPATDEDNDDDEDDLNKADLPPAVRARLEKAETEAAEMRKRVEKAETVAAGERDTRLTRDFIAKAEKLPSLGNADEVGPVLKTIADSVPAETYEALEKMLTATNEQIAKGELFAEQGAGGEAKRDGGAYEEAMAKAQEIRKSDTKLSQADAMDRVLDEDPKLAARYLAETR